MRSLASNEIEKLARKKGVNRKVVRDYLSSIKGSYSEAIEKFVNDARVNEWNQDTRYAISRGIVEASTTTETGKSLGPIPRARKFPEYHNWKLAGEKNGVKYYSKFKYEYGRGRPFFVGEIKKSSNGFHVSLYVNDIDNLDYELIPKHFQEKYYEYEWKAIPYWERMELTISKKGRNLVFLGLIDTKRKAFKELDEESEAILKTWP